ncbi:MAG: hypothetical protein OHK0052_18780 [Anaerolineales bacterium]
MKFSAFTFPLALLALIIAAFGLQLTRLGFYWDDFPTVWFIHTLGPEGLQQVFASDRPFLGVVFRFVGALLGDSAIRWQVFALMARWLATLAFWFAVRAIWQHKPQQTAWMAAAFAVYPGFMQQWISVTYGVDWLLYAAFLASLGLMLHAVRSPLRSARFWGLSAGALICAAFAMFSTEYFLGLELLRPILLWMTLDDAPKARLRRAALHAVPYGALLLFFVYWRVILHPFPRATLAMQPNLPELALTAVQDVLEASLAAWSSILTLARLLDFASPNTLTALGLTVLTGALVALYFQGFAPPSGEAAPTRAPRMFTFGVLALFAAGAPTWATDLPLRLVFPWDRFTLQMMFGVSIALIAALDGLIGSRRAKIALLAGLLGLASGFHLQTSETYRKAWESQRRFFAQLTWRAPQIAPGTLLMSDPWAFTLYTDNSLTAPLNWIYAPDLNAYKMPYLFFDITKRMESGELSDLSNDLAIEHVYRATYFTGNTGQALVFHYAPPDCLRILDPQIDIHLPGYSNLLYHAAHLSDLSLIDPNPPQAAQLPLQFGAEPRRDWCFYYEQADLARTQADWARIAELGNAASEKKLFARSPAEYLPFIEGYGMTGDWQQAAALTRRARDNSPALAPILCQTWARLLQNTADSPPRAEVWQVLSSKLECP